MMLTIALLSVLLMISNATWVQLYLMERKRRIQAGRIASHFFTLCQAMNDGSTFFLGPGGKPELRQ